MLAVIPVAVDRRSAVFGRTLADVVEPARAEITHLQLSLALAGSLLGDYMLTRNEDLVRRFERTRDDEERVASTEVVRAGTMAAHAVQQDRYEQLLLSAARLDEAVALESLGTLGRWFIDRGMRKGTPVELHDHVITAYGGTGDWKQRLSYSPAHEDDAYLVVLDREGVVRWLHHGGFDTAWSDELKTLLASLARPVDR